MKNFLLFLLILSFQVFTHSQSSNPELNSWVVQGTVHTITADETHTYIGGSFNHVGPRTGYGAKLTKDSVQPDSAFPIVNGIINVCIPDGFGGWYIGGSFTKVGDAVRNRLARINSDGTVNLWNPDANNSVSVMVLDGDFIYVGGSFTTIGGVSRSRAAKVKVSDASIDPYWNPSPNSGIHSMAKNDNYIFVGGDFTFIGGQSRSKIAKLNKTNGDAETNWSPNPESAVYSIFINGSDVYVGGYFTTIGGQQRNYAAKLNDFNGTVDVNWNPNPNNPVFSFALNGSYIYLGGMFTSVGGETRNYLAKVNATDGSLDAAWNPDANGVIHKILPVGSYIYIVGKFTLVGNTARNRVARVEPTYGSVDASWDPNANNWTYEIAINGDDVFIGGAFTSIGGKTRNKIARLYNSTGFLDETWDPNASGDVLSITINNNDILVGGVFETIGGQSIPNLAKLTKTSPSPVMDWNPSPNGAIRTIVVDGSNIYVAGDFSYIGGQNRGFIARLNNSNGSADASWNPNANGWISSIVVSEQNLYVGGIFTNIGGLSRNRIAKIDMSTGYADAAWDPNPNDYILSLALDGNYLYAGGNFTSIGGSTRNYLAKLNLADGTALQSWSANADSRVQAITLNSNDIFVGGFFNSIGGQSQKYIAKLSSIDGAVSSDWNPIFNSSVRAIQKQGNFLHTGGGFSLINNEVFQGYARFKLPETSTLTLTDPNGRNKLRTNEEYNIQWWSEHINSIDIDYTTDNGNTWINIATNQPASEGNYLWRVPNTPSEQCKVRIKDSNGTLSDESDETFRIVYAELRIIQPNGGEVLSAGSNYEIKWSSADIKKVTLAYSTDNGENWDYIGSDSAHFGSFQWLVPNTPSNQCKLIIQEYYQAIIGEGKESFLIDTSDNVFSIELNPCPDLPSITYEGKTYNTVQIGDQCWLRENLDVGVMISGSFNQTNNSIIEKYCYDNDTSNCNTYGGLYQWDEAMQYSTFEGTQGICPDGWHIPTDSEWKKMEMYLGMSESMANSTGWRGTIEGDKLKYVSGWNSEGEGTNESGFAALAGGYRYYYNQSFLSIGEKSDWWTSSDYDEAESWVRRLSNDYSPVYRYHYNKNNGQYVRCLKDEIPPDTLSLLSPNGGEKWVAGNTYSIEWKSTANVGVVKIEYSTNSGAEWNYIGDENAYVQSFEWTVANTPSTNCLVRIYVYGEEESVLGDTSDTVFKILPPAPSVSSINPDSGVVGTSIQISGANLDSTKFVTFQSDNENTLTLIGHTDFVRSVAISPDGKIIASGARNDTQIRLSRKDDGTLLKTLTGHTNAVVSLVFNSDGTQLISGSWDQTIKVWDVSSGSLIKTINTGSGINGIALNNMKNIVASANDDNTVKLWDLNNSALIRTLTGHNSAVQCVAFNHQGNRVAAGEWNSTVRIWNINNGNVEGVFTGHQTMVFSTAFTSDDRKLLSGDNYGNVKVWDLDGGIELAAWTAGHVRSLAISPGDSTVAIGGGNNVLLYNLNTGNLLANLEGHTDGIMSVCFSKDGSTLVSGSLDKTVNLWRTRVPAPFEILSAEQIQVSASVPDFSKNGQIALGTISGTALSSDIFKVLKPSLMVNDPNGGEKLRVGKNYIIKWSSNYSTQIKIDYSTDGGNSWMPVSGSMPAQYPDGYDWEVPNTPSASCLIKISDLNDTLMFDISDAAFEIYQPSLQLVKPEGGEIIKVDKNFEIKWNAEHIEKVKLIYSTDIGTTWDVIIDNYDTQVDNYMWIVPNTPSNNCLVAITDHSDSTIADTCNTTFSIVQPAVVIQHPNGGERFRVDKTYQINWTTNYVDTVGIQYSTDNGNNWDTVVNFASGGTYNWLIPDTPSENCLIKIYDIHDYAIADTSDDVFEIYKPTLSLLTPIGGENWLINSMQDITWSSNDVDTLKLEYSTNNGESWLQLDNPLIPGGPQTYGWIIPNTPSPYCKVRISEHGYPNLFDTSDNVFRIIKDTLDIGLIAYYPFTENHLDYSGYNNNGTNHGVTLTEDRFGNATAAYYFPGNEWISVPSSPTLNGITNGLTLSAWIKPEALENQNILNKWFDGTGTDRGFFFNTNSTGKLWSGILDDNNTLLHSKSLIAKRWQYVVSTWDGTNLKLYVDGKLIADRTTSGTFINQNVVLGIGADPNPGPKNFFKGIIDDIRIYERDLSEAEIEKLYQVNEWEDAYITVFSPNNEESLEIGTSYDITWERFNVESVKIEYSTNSGIDWILINSSVPAFPSTYEWIVPGTPSTECLVRITDVYDPQLGDTSGMFEIYQRSITVLAPNGGEELKVGNNFYISWESSHIDYIDLKYSINNGDSWLLIDGNVSAENGNYMWTIPDSPSENCLIQISESGNSKEGFVFDISDSVFTIFKPSLTLLVPNGGEEWRVDNTYEIEWNSTHLEFVGIEYSTDSGQNWDFLDVVPAGNGSYEWTIPNTPSDQCKVRIFESGGGTIGKESVLSDTSDNVFKIYQPTITVIQPNGGEGWRVGEEYNILWSSTYLYGSIGIEYTTNNGQSWMTIDQVPTSHNGYTWTIPDTPSEECKVRVYEIGEVNPVESLVSDTSDNVFTIYKPTLTVIQPNGGEEWRVGAQYSINWESSNIDYVDIEYSTDNGESWLYVTAASSASNGSYLWIIPDTPSEECLIRINESGGVKEELISDISDSVFTIFKPSITVVTPNGGEEWRVDNTYSIKWNSSYVSSVKLEYTTDNGDTWLFINNSMADAGSYEWLIPDTPSELCKVRITDNYGTIGEALTSDTSDNVFRIYKPFITVIQPNGGEQWRVDEYYSIDWLSSDVDYVSLEYTTNNGNNWNFIANVSAGLGTYNWLIPDTPSDQCKVRIMEFADKEMIAGDTSNAVFTIYRPVLTIISPNGGEMIEVRKNHLIQWNAERISHVDIYYSTNNGTSWNNIVSAHPASSLNYSWLVPNTPSENCKLLITEAGVKDGIMSDTSDAVFTIFDPERNALISFFNATNGTNWNNKTNWNTFEPLSTWYGVTVTEDRVTGINLSNNNLSGIIPQAFEAVTELEEFDVSNNSINGWYPPSAGTFTKLKILNLSHNQIAGDIPEAFLSLVTLKEIYLNQNSITGNISASFGNLVNLTKLNLANNSLTGNLPVPLFNLSGLKELNLSGNQLSGNIPSQIGNLVNLEILLFGMNQFTGSIPAEVNALINLKEMDLHSNQFNGTIPVGLWGLTSLQVLDLSSNGISGSIPINIGNLTNLSKLNLSNNTLTGGIPTQIGGLTNLLFLSLSDNQFDGTLPTQTANLVNLRELYLSKNSFVDLPVLTPLISLQKLHVEENRLTFEDIEPNLNVPSVEFIYSPQAVVGNTIDTTVVAGSSLTLKMKVGGANNFYQWKKNGVIIPNSNDTLYIIPSVSINDTGSYTCEITNTLATALTIYSNPVNVTLQERIELTSPNGGEKLRANSSFNITWSLNQFKKNGFEQNGTVKIEFSTNSGTTWSEIATSHPMNTLLYNWTVPYLAANQCLIRITDNEFAQNSDVSDSTFTVYIPSLTVITPNGGEFYPVSKQRNISWITENVNFVKIDYTTNNGGTWITIESSLPANQNNYIWTIPNTPSAECKIRIYDAEADEFFDTSDSTFTIVVPVITVTSPNGGEDWQVNLPKNITWSISHVDSVTIQYSTDNGQSWITIVPSIVANIGTYNWLVPNTPSTQSKVRILDVENNAFGDTSDNVFRIFLPAITVTSPNGGEDWQVNTTKTITWTSVDVANVKIEYTTDNGQSWLLITNSVPATPASYEWLIPNTLSTQSKVRITDVAFPEIGDTSDNVFRIFLPEITVTSPNGGEDWQVNLTKTITWTSVDVANVKIEYTTDNGQSWLLITNSVPATPASYEWLIPNTPSTQSKVRITDVAFPDIGDTSDNVFRIFLPEITVISPNGGEDWQVNLPKNITWTSVDVANVKIEYTTNNGQNWLEIANSVPATPASYEWLIPNTPSTQTKVRITDVAFPDIGDTSDNVFRIFLPEITVTSPNGGEDWQVNLPKNITWTSVDVANVKIEYTTNNGQSWLEVVNSVPATPGSFEWMVPNTPSAQAKVRIINIAFPDIGDTSDNVFRIFRPGVTVISPNGAEQWQVGTTQNITWISADVANVKIDYSTNNGISWNEEIASTVAGTGSFPWLIPDTESNQCKVRIIDIAYPEYADTSDGVFRIFMPKVTVTSPNGGEQWQVGQQYNITWTSSDMANVKIDYTTNSGGNWINIISSTPAAPGSFAWTIPNTPSQLCKVRITDVANPTIGDSSDAIFRIFLPALTVATPNGAEQWQVGTQQNITWTSADVANVKIEYTTNNGTSWINIVNSVPASPALYQWTIPNTPSTQCKVRITNVAFPNIGDTSDNVFRIFLPAVTVVSPNGGEQWQANTQKNITWTSSDMANVKIEYSTNNGTNWIAVVNSTPATPASYTWTVPSTPSTQCRVRVSDASNASINDVSNNVFNIFLPVITVVTPNGGERWLSGSVQSVTYTSQHVDTVAIEYSTNSGQSWIAVGTSAASGQYQWTIPNTASENCKIRIMQKSNYTIGDTSNAVFAIYSPAVTVVTPNGGEQWLIGSQQSIRWTSKDIDTLRIELSTNSGVSWISVIEKVPAASGEYLWTIPDISSEQCLIRLTDIAIPTIRDVSNNIFTIFKPRVTIIKPVGGEKFKVGTTQNISWTSSNSQNVRIEYTSNAGSTWNSIVESVPASAINYNWTIPNTPAPDCKIRILDVTYPSFGDTTDLSFSIVAPSMQVVSPNGGEKLIVGKWETIKWATYFVDSMRIEYSTNNGNDWLPIAQSVIVDTGTAGFSWLIPETPSQQCLVRIFDLALPTFGDTSDLVFAIFKPTVTLISPNGGEKYFVGIAYDIAWSSSEVDSVKIEYSVNDGSSWINIADAIPAELGTFNWIVPNTPSTICKVRITDVRFNDVTDRSDDNFTIAVIQLPIYLAIHQNPALTKYCDLVVICDSLLESAPYVEASSPKDTLIILMNQIANSNYAYSGAYKFDSTGVYSFYVKIKASIGIEKDTVRNFTVVLAKPGQPSNIRSLDLLANLSIAPELIQEETYFVSDINQNKKETIYLFSPNRNFAQPTPLEITYSTDAISDPAKLFIYQMQEGGWVPLRSQVYPKNQRIKSYVNNLGKFKIEVDESFTGSNIVPDVYTLKQNYPNPFNPQTTIEFDLREDAVTSLIIYDILGRQVKTIYNDFQLAGSYRIQWDGRNDYNETVASGIYFYRLYSGEFISVKKMVLIR